MRWASFRRIAARRWMRCSRHWASAATSACSDRTRHVELELEDGMTYTPGDAVGIIPENRREAVDEVLAALGFRGDERVLRSDAACRAGTRRRHDVYAGRCGGHHSGESPRGGG